MPLYEYECPGCGGRFEKLVRRMGDADRTKCPGCGNEHARKRVSTFAVAGMAQGGATDAPAPRRVSL
jgi:putative FmdB family regulatory protein